MKPMKPIYAHGLLLLAAASWGLGNVAQKTILEDLGVLTATGLATLLAAAFLSPALLAENVTKSDQPTLNYRATLVIAMLFTLATSGMHLSFAGTSVTNATFIVNICAVLTPFAGWLLYRELPPFRVWPAGLLTLVGIGAIGGGNFTALAWGDWVGLATAVIFSIWLPMVGRHVTKTGRAVHLTLVQFIFCGAVCTTIGLATEPFSWQALENAVPELVMMGIFAKFIAYFLLAIAQKHTPASSAAIVSSAEAIFSALFAYIFLNEAMPPHIIWGAALIIAAIVLVQGMPIGFFKFKSVQPQPPLANPGVSSSPGGLL
jgi:drug/metabolite transporter (DMT)-like permease